MICKEDKLIQRLQEHLEWAQANEWETPITLSDDIEMAIKLLKQYNEFSLDTISVIAKLFETLADIRTKYSATQKENRDLRHSLDQVLSGEV